MESNENNEVKFIEDNVFTSTYDLIKYADSTGMSAKQFIKWLNSKGYSLADIVKLTMSYKNLYGKSINE